MPSGGLQIARGVAADRESLPRGGAAARGELSQPPPCRRAGRMHLTERSHAGAAEGKGSSGPWVKLSIHSFLLGSSVHPKI